MKKDNYRYRIFVSYSNKDKCLAERLDKILRENGLRPVSHKQLISGADFINDIQKLIAHSHVFVPLISKFSKKSEWVNQEIGYATAYNVPILPIKIDSSRPGAMIEHFHAENWNDDGEILKEKISFERIKILVESAQNRSENRFVPLFERGLLHNDRTQLMSKFSSEAFKFGFKGHVRQRGALSTFHLPNKQPSNPIWREVLGTELQGEVHYRELWQERQELERHARDSGCSIIIDPFESYIDYGDESRIARLEVLLEFLISMPDDKVNVGIKTGLPKQEHLTIVGDWFVAETLSYKVDVGYMQTIFTRYAPFVKGYIEAFDEELESIIKRQDLSHCSSREYSIQTIKQIINELRAKKSK